MQKIFSQERFPRSVVLLFLVALFLRLLDLGGKCFWLDESFSLLLARSSPLEILRESASNHSAPLRDLLLHFLVRLGGPEGKEMTTRLPSALAGAALVPLCYGMGRRLFGQLSGLGAAGFVLLHPWLLLHAQDNRMHGVFLFFAALELYLVLEIVVGGKRDWKRWALLGAVIALHAYLSYLAILPVLGLALYLCWEIARRLICPWARRREGLRLLAGSLVACGVLLLLSIPQYPSFLNLVGFYEVEVTIPGAGEVAAPPPAEPQGSLRYSTQFDLASQWGRLVQFGGGGALAGGLIFCLALAGAVDLARRHPALLVLPLAWLLSLVLVLQFTSAGFFFPVRYMLYLMAPYALLVGRGLALCAHGLARLAPLRRGLARRRRRFAVAALLAIAPVWALQFPGAAHYYLSEKQDWSGLMLYLDRNAAPGDIVALQDRASGLCIAAVLQDRKLDSPLVFRPRVFTPAEIQAELQAHPRLWYVHWSKLPEPSRQSLRSRMQAQAHFPGLINDIFLWRSYRYERTRP